MGDMNFVEPIPESVIMKCLWCGTPIQELYESKNLKTGEVRYLQACDKDCAHGVKSIEKIDSHIKNEGWDENWIIDPVVEPQFQRLVPAKAPEVEAKAL